MNLELYSIFVIVLLFGLISLFQDFQTRKVKNSLTYLFIFYSIIVFLFNFNMFEIDYILITLLIISIISSYLGYRYNIFGAADGKILIGIAFLLSSLETSYILLHYWINLIIIYTIYIILLTQIISPKVSKINSIKKVNLFYRFVQVLIVFLFSSSIFNFFNVSNSLELSVMLSVFILILFSYISSYIKRTLKIIHDYILYLLTVIGLGCLVYFFGLKTIVFFLFVYIIVIFIEITTNLAEDIEDRKNFYSPFTAHIFVSMILTLLLSNSILFFVVNLV